MKTFQTLDKLINSILNIHSQITNSANIEKEGIRRCWHSGEASVVDTASFAIAADAIAVAATISTANPITATDPAADNSDAIAGPATSVPNPTTGAQVECEPNSGNYTATYSSDQCERRK